MAELFSDPFSGAGAPADPPWTTMHGTFSQSGGVLQCASAGSAGYAAMRRNDVTVGLQSYGEFVYGGESGGNNGIMLRAAGTGATLGGYYVILSNSSHDVFVGKIVNRDTFTDFTSFHITISSGQTLRLELNASNELIVRVNGVQQGSNIATDGTFTSAGQVGVFSDNVSSSVTSLAAGGDVATAAKARGIYIPQRPRIITRRRFF